MSLMFFFDREKGIFTHNSIDINLIQRKKIIFVNYKEEKTIYNIDCKALYGVSDINKLFMTYLTNHNSKETIESEFKEKLIIKGKRIPLFASLILTVILMICVLSPIIITVIIISNAQDFNIGNIVFFILLWGGGFYILRLLLWNTFGKEYLFLHDNKIVYIADYKLFKDGRQEIQIKNLKIDIIHEEEPEKSLGRLLISNETEKLETVFQTNIAELEIIATKIKTFYN